MKLFELGTLIVVFGCIIGGLICGGIVNCAHECYREEHPCTSDHCGCDCSCHIR